MWWLWFVFFFKVDVVWGMLVFCGYYESIFFFEFFDVFVVFGNDGVVFWYWECFFGYEVVLYINNYEVFFGIEFYLIIYGS